MLSFSDFVQELAKKRASGEEETVPEFYDKLIKMLEAIHLPIPMNFQTDWVLNSTHVKVAFRIQVHVHNLLQCIDSKIRQPSEMIEAFGLISLLVVFA